MKAGLFFSFFFFIFNNIYSIDNQQSKILTNTTILTLLTIQYLEYNRLRLSKTTYSVYNVKTYELTGLVADKFVKVGCCRKVLITHSFRK